MQQQRPGSPPRSRHVDSFVSHTQSASRPARLSRSFPIDSAPAQRGKPRRQREPSATRVIAQEIDSRIPHSLTLRASRLFSAPVTQTQAPSLMPRSIILHRRRDGRVMRIAYACKGLSGMALCAGLFFCSSECCACRWPKYRGSHLLKSRRHRSHARVINLCARSHSVSA